MRLSNIVHITLLFFSSSVWALSSDSTLIGDSGDPDYYIFPIRPYQVNTLAGNMGELRESHFHAGLDIRTGGQIGLPVYAAADGYISRAAVKVAGYGKALYLTHDNGETTVYAHLSKFNGDIAKYSKDYQYANRSLHFNKYFNETEFRVKKGDVIAYSGNSGSSAGPHLHFEIRDKDQKVLNPQKYNFEEIRDTTPPIFRKLAITPKDIHSRINGVFGRITYDIDKQGDQYLLTDTLDIYGKVAFELLAYDKLNDANYKCAISEISFKLDNKRVFYQKIDTLNFSNQRNILTHYNYPAYIASGEKFHKLYQDDGNLLSFYETNSSKGIISQDKNSLKKGAITIKDVLGNVSELSFYVNSLEKYEAKYSKTSQLEEISISENILKITQPIDYQVSIRMNKKSSILIPSYDNGISNIYLLDLRNGIPEQILSNGKMLEYTQSLSVIPGKTYKYYSKFINIAFGQSALFDTLYFHTSYNYDQKEKKEYYNIGNSATSFLKQHIKMTLLSDIHLVDSLRVKTSVYQIIGDQFGFKGGDWTGNHISFKTRTFGQYTILTDSIPPTIFPISISNESIRFSIKDNLSGINKIDAFVDNQWILMDYDYKISQIWSDKIDDQLFSGQVIIRVIDNVGNSQTYKTKIPL